MRPGTAQILVQSAPKAWCTLARATEGTRSSYYPTRCPIELHLSVANKQRFDADLALEIDHHCLWLTFRSHSVR